MSGKAKATNPGNNLNNGQENLEIDSRSYWQDAVIRFKRNKAAVVCFCVLVLLVLLVIVGPMFCSWRYDQIDWDNIAAAPSSLHLFGTDENGRDVLARILFGGRISLTIGFGVALVSLIIGVLYGSIAGYYGGWLDSIMMRAIEVVDCIPTLFLIILIVTIFGNSLTVLILLMSFTGWFGKARIIRAQTISLKKREFVEAAHVVGVSNFKIVVKHIVPNLMSTIVIYFSASVPGAISLESGLSYLGLGVQEPLSSWGTLISNGAQVMQTAPWLLFYPSLFLSTTIFVFAFIGDGLRDALDPKER